MAAVLVDPAIGKAGDFDSVSVILKTASGKQAVISNSRRATYGYDQRIEVHGSKGRVGVGGEPARRCRSRSPTPAGYTRPPLHDFFMTRYTEAYAATRSPPSSTRWGEDGLLALALAEAALKSVAEGRVVKMSEVL
jgi:myo-inositol 2-dehydrogenase/D-chiro-inositol 1-dehydrogenase